MNVSRFLGFEWKKVIVPIVFIILFFILMDYLMSYSAITDKYICNITAEAAKIKQLVKANELVSANASMMVFVRLDGGLSKELGVLMDSFSLSPLRYPASFVYIIDPLFPAPCEIYFPSYLYFPSGLWGDSLCQFYISRNTYDCVVGYVSLFGVNSDTREYSELSISFVLLNILLLFAEGYLISCAIVFFGRWFLAKYRIRREWARLVRRWSRVSG